MIHKFFLDRFGPTGTKVLFWAAIVFVVLAIGLGLYLTGRSDGKQGEVVGQLEREVKVQGQVGQANEGSANRQAQDEVRTALNQKELQDALEASTDPDRRRALRGCVVMRQQGRDTSHLAACSRPASRP